MKKVTVIQRGNRRTATAAELAADYKMRGASKYKAWDWFVIDRAMQPEMDAKDFYKVFGSVSPDALDKDVEVTFEATHIDTMFDVECMIHDDENGVHHIIWEVGMTGSHPPNDETFYERFKKI